MLKFEIRDRVVEILDFGKCTINYVCVCLLNLYIPHLQCIQTFYSKQMSVSLWMLTLLRTLQTNVATQTHAAVWFIILSFETTDGMKALLLKNP